jgi:TPR repeat protein
MSILSINNLQDEILFKIFDHFTNVDHIKNLLICSQVSQLWRSVAQDNSLWKGKWGVDALINPSQAFKETIPYLKVLYRQERDPGKSPEENYAEGLKSHDVSLARSCFEKAAKKGHFLAIDKLIHLLENTAQDALICEKQSILLGWKALRKLLEESRNPGCPTNKVSQLGILFLSGKYYVSCLAQVSIDPSLRKAISYFKRAEKMGSLRARAALQEIQLSDDKEHPFGFVDKEKSLEDQGHEFENLSREAKLAGFPEKSYQMGLRYLGLQPENCRIHAANSEERAIKCFKTAAEQNHKKAQALLDYYSKYNTI